MTETPLTRFWQGVRDELPILIGVIPFGAIYGLLAVSAGLAPAEAQGMSAIVFAGASQFVLVQMLQNAAPPFLLVLTVFIINLRHALYSAAVAPYLRGLSLRWKILLSYLLTDEAFVVGMAGYQRNGLTQAGHWYLLGAGLALWSSWQLSTAAGIFLGAQIPAAWGLDFTLPLTFIALAVPSIRARSTLAAALTASFVALLLHSLPYGLGTLLAILAGLAGGAIFLQDTPA